MLKREITYTDFDGNEVTEEFYFNLMRTEILKMEVGGEGGSLHDQLKRIIASDDRSSLVNEFQNIILKSYGVRSEDGKRFIKDPQLTEEFSQTPAFDVLFFELATNAKSAADFILGVMPKDMAEEVAKQQPQDKPIGPPPRPPVK